MGNEKRKFNSYEKHHKQKNLVLSSVQIQILLWHFANFDQKKSVGLVRAYWVQKAEKLGWLFTYSQILLCLYRGVCIIVSPQSYRFLWDFFLEWKVTDRRKVEFISKA